MQDNKEEYEIISEGEDNVLRIDYESSPYVPSIEDSDVVMSRTISVLASNTNVTKIVFVQKRDYEYDYSQTQLLVELAKFYTKFSKMKDLFGYTSLATDCSRCMPYMHGELNRLIFSMLISDPFGAYVELKRLERRERIKTETLLDAKCISCEKKFIRLLDYLIAELDKLQLIKAVRHNLPGYIVGDRTLYRQLFRPVIKPDFMFTKLMASYPTYGEELASYMIENTEITVFGFPDSVKYLYHMVPPEFKLSEEKYDILSTARNVMAEHKPKKSEFVDPKRMRQVFYNVGSDLIQDLSDNRGIKLRDKEITELTNILVRYTVGFGLIEVLLSDEKVQDISINSPMGQIPIFIVHQDFDDCYTNIVPTTTEAESWATKLRLISGRPLDEANQILDTEISLPNASARISAITNPLAPNGLAYSFRRHRDKPWTLPLFCHVDMLTPLAAGCLSFLIDGTRTMLIAGTRSSGKTSFLGSLLIEIMRRYRMITIEDTLELPSESLRKLGYNIQNMKVASALTKAGTEMQASDGIRATLRLGDSALIVGEVRSKEAVALYEAMRVGAAANVVAGTIHSDSPYGVFDRVVNDIGIPKTSFKATDVVCVVNPVRSADGIHRFRRVTQLTEVRKTWEDDPLTEKGFVDLFKYDAKTDKLEPSNDLLNGDSEVLKTVAGNIKEFAGNWDAVWENIQLRGRLKETLVSTARKTKDFDLLEAEFVIASNDKYHKLAESVKDEVGYLDNQRIFFEWNEWLKREVKKRTLKQNI